MLKIVEKEKCQFGAFQSKKAQELSNLTLMLTPYRFCIGWDGVKIASRCNKALNKFG